MFLNILIRYKFIKKLIGFSIILWTALPCWSQTWQKLADDFVNYNPSLAQLKAEAGISKQKVYEGYSKIAPSLTYNFLGTYQNRPAPNASFGAFSSAIFPPESFRNELEASWALYAGGRIWGTVSLNRLASKSSQLAYSQAQNEGLFQIFKLAIQIYDATEQKRVLLESQETQKKYLNLVLKKQRTGNVTPYEVNQAQADYYSYLPRIINLDTKITNLQIAAKKSLGQNIRLETSMFAIKTKPEQISLKNLNDEALKNRYDLKLNELQSKSVDINRDLLFSTHRPQVTLTAAFGFQTQDYDDIWSSKYYGHAVNLNIRWKIFEGGALFSRLKMSSLEKLNFEKSRQSLLDSVRAELQGNYELGQSLKKLLKETKRWQEQTQLALSKGQSSYRIGKVSQLEWLQLQKADEASQLALISVKSQFLQQEIEMYYLLGRDLMNWARKQ